MSRAELSSRGNRMKLTRTIRRGTWLCALALPLATMTWISAQGGNTDTELRGIISTNGLKGDAILSRVNPIPAIAQK